MLAHPVLDLGVDLGRDGPDVGEFVAAPRNLERRMAAAGSP